MMAPIGTKQESAADDDLDVDAQDLGIWQKQFGGTPVTADTSETLTLSAINPPFLGEAIVLLALKGTNSQQTDIFDIRIPCGDLRCPVGVCGEIMPSVAAFIGGFLIAQSTWTGTGNAKTQPPDWPDTPNDTQ